MLRDNLVAESGGRLNKIYHIITPRQNDVDLYQSMTSNATGKQAQAIFQGEICTQLCNFLTALLECNKGPSFQRHSSFHFGKLNLGAAALCIPSLPETKGNKRTTECTPDSWTKDITDELACLTS